MLGQSEDSSQAPSIDQLKLEHIDLGHEFKLESFQLSECSDEVNSRGLSSNISEEVLSLVEALISVPSEPTGVTKKEAELFH